MKLITTISATALSALVVSSKDANVWNDHGVLKYVTPTSAVPLDINCFCAANEVTRTLRSVVKMSEDSGVNMEPLRPMLSIMDMMVNKITQIIANGEFASFGLDSVNTLNEHVLNFKDMAKYTKFVRKAFGYFLKQGGGPILQEIMQGPFVHLYDGMNEKSIYNRIFNEFTQKFEELNGQPIHEMVNYVDTPEQLIRFVYRALNTLVDWLDENQIADLSQEIMGYFDSALQIFDEFTRTEQGGEFIRNLILKIDHIREWEERYRWMEEMPDKYSVDDYRWGMPEKTGTQFDDIREDESKRLYDQPISGSKTRKRRNTEGEGDGSGDHDDDFFNQILGQLGPFFGAFMEYAFDAEDQDRFTPVFEAFGNSEALKNFIGPFYTAAEIDWNDPTRMVGQMLDDMPFGGRTANFKKALSEMINSDAFREMVGFLFGLPKHIMSVIDEQAFVDALLPMADKMLFSNMSSKGQTIFSMVRDMTGALTKPNTSSQEMLDGLRNVGYRDDIPYADLCIKPHTKGFPDHKNQCEKWNDEFFYLPNVHEDDDEVNCMGLDCPGDHHTPHCEGEDCHHPSPHCEGDDCHHPTPHCEGEDCHHPPPCAGTHEIKEMLEGFFEKLNRRFDALPERFEAIEERIEKMTCDTRTEDPEDRPPTATETGVRPESAVDPMSGTKTPNLDSNDLETNPNRFKMQVEDIALIGNFASRPKSGHEDLGRKLEKCVQETLKRCLAKSDQFQRKALGAAFDLQEANKFNDIDSMYAAMSTGKTEVETLAKAMNACKYHGKAAGMIANKMSKTRGSFVDGNTCFSFAGKGFVEVFAKSRN